MSIGLEEEKKRTRERELFQSAYQKALELNQKSSSEMVQKYEEDKAKASVEIFSYMKLTFLIFFLK